MGPVHRVADAPLSRVIVGARERGAVPVMADIKPVSRRDGDLPGARRPADLARRLQEAGACALSVVTEAEHFGGSCAVLEEVADAVSLPVLRKDFLSAPDQIEASRAAGASAVLLILATTPDSLAASLYGCARELGLEAVVEIHTRKELDRALELDPTIIGINNRNILELEKDPGDVGIADGDWVYIETPLGRIRQKARLCTDFDPRYIVTQHGWWFPERPAAEPSLYGLWESNINVTTDDDPDLCDPISGGWPFKGQYMRCRIYKAAEGE